jgi:alanyl-tRNA synthetase
MRIFANRKQAKHHDMDEPILNEHNKQEYPPMHTAEHLLNGEMARRYGCGRAFNAHIERKKSKLDYHLPSPLTDAELRSLEQYVNAIVDEDVAVTTEYITQAEALTRFDLSRLPEGASDTVRVVKVGPYDECLCAGQHVAHTAEIGHLRITNAKYEDGVERLIFKLEG